MKQGLSGKSGPQLQKSVKTQFSSTTFKKQVDKIIDDLYIYTLSSADKLMNKSLSAGLTRSPVSNFLSAADTNTQDDDESLTEEALYLALTLETVNECIELSQDIVESIEKVLKEDAAIQETTRSITEKILDIWGKQKYKSENWVRTFSVDVVTNTSLYRYSQNGIEYSQIYATIDERTSQYCRMMHGTIFKVNSPEARRYRPPFHFRCRTTIRPYITTGKINNDLLFENRDFSKSLTQNLKKFDSGIDSNTVKSLFKNVDNFKDKYSVPQSILNKDVKMRIEKLKFAMAGK